MGEALAAVEEEAGVPRGRQCIIVTGEACAMRPCTRLAVDQRAPTHSIAREPQHLRNVLVCDAAGKRVQESAYFTLACT